MGVTWDLHGTWSEGIAKAKRRQNEGLAKEERRTNEGRVEDEFGGEK